MAVLVIGVYQTVQDVSLVIEKLKNKKVSVKHISVVSGPSHDLRQISHDTGVKVPQSGNGSQGMLSLLKELMAALQIIPEEVSAAGPAAAVMAGADLGRDTDDVVVGLMNAGIPEQDARYYKKQLDNGNLLLLVQCSRDDAQRNTDILKLQ